MKSSWVLDEAEAAFDLTTYLGPVMNVASEVLIRFAKPSVPERAAAFSHAKLKYNVVMLCSISISVSSNLSIPKQWIRPKVFLIPHGYQKALR
jgi:hypothetical protein